MRHGPRLERRTHAILTPAFQRALVVLCLSPFELPLLFLPRALSKVLVLMLLLLVTLLVALTVLLVRLATLLFKDSQPFHLNRAQLLLPKAICLSFLSLGYKTLLFEKGFAVEALLFLSAQLFVETDLFLSFPPKIFLESLFLEPPPPRILKEALFVETPLLLLKASLLFECLLFLPLRLSL